MKRRRNRVLTEKERPEEKLYPKTEIFRDKTALTLNLFTKSLDF